LGREPLTATPGVGACENAITYCISDSRLNQQQRRYGEEQKVSHDILPAFLKILSWPPTRLPPGVLSNDLCHEGKPGIEVSPPGIRLSLPGQTDYVKKGYPQTWRVW
jgi:hypothetical protein